MVIDASGLLAILLDEPERRAFNEAIEAATSRVMSVANLLEVSYALATVHGERLLYKGDDFARTDVVAAAPAARS